jgi:hypothetical protein
VSAGLRLAGGLGILVAIGAVAAATDHPVGAPTAPRPTVSPAQHSTLVCPWTSGGPAAPTTVTVADVTPLLHPAGGGHPRVSVRDLTARGVTRPVTPAPTTTVRWTGPGAGLAVTADGSAADAIAAEQDQLVSAGPHRALLSAACLAASTDWWITGADGRIGHSDALALANPGTTEANVTVTAWSTRGRSSPPHLQSYSLAPGETVRLPVADYVPDAGFVTFHVHANTGRVSAQVIDFRGNGLRAAGGDWIGPTQPPATHAVVPGFAGGRGPRLLALTNPGTSDATVGLRLFTTKSNFVPAGHQQVVVTAGHSTYVDLTEAFGGVPGAVGVDSDAPVTAAGLTVMDPGGGATPDLQWQPAAAPLNRPAVLADNAPPFGDFAWIYLTAPDAAATVTLRAGGRSTVVSVPAGRTITAAPITLLGAAGRGPVLVTASGGAVYASRTLYARGVHGPLITASIPVLVPAPSLLPPAVADPAAAVR